MSWLIVDVANGLMDGYYLEKEMAQRVFDQFLKDGATSIVLTEVQGQAENIRISNKCFHASSQHKLYPFTGMKNND